MLGFAKMIAQARCECAVRGLVDHLWQGFHDLVFGVVDILQRVEEQILHGLDVLSKKSHDGSPMRPTQRRASGNGALITFGKALVPSRLEPKRR